MSEKPYQCPKRHRHTTQRAAEHCHACRRAKDAAVRRHFKAISDELLARVRNTGKFFRLTLVRDPKLLGGHYRVTGCFELSPVLVNAVNAVDVTAATYLHITSVRPWPVGSACNPRQVLEETQARQAIVRAVNKVGSELPYKATVIYDDCLEIVEGTIKVQE